MDQYSHHNVAPIIPLSTEKRLEKIIHETQRFAEKEGVKEDRDLKSLRQNIEENLSKRTKEQVRETIESKYDLEKRRAHRNVFKKSGNALQNFSSQFSHFLENFSGIETIVRGINPMVGGVVVGALSVVLMVGRNKKGREIAIEAAFKELSYWVGQVGQEGRLRLYYDAHPSAKMTGLVEEVYLNIGEFAVECQRYYQRPSYVRVWQALSQPPKFGVDLTVKTITQSVMEVVSEGLANLCADHAAERRQVMQDDLHWIADGLDVLLEDADLGKLISGQKYLLAHSFGVSHRHQRRGVRLQEANLKLLQTLGVFQDWMEDILPTVLLLSGRNYDDYETGRNLCWLSPTAAEVADHIQQSVTGQRTSRILFYPVKRADEPQTLTRRRETLDACLSNLILQVLSWDTSLVRKEREFIKRTMKSKQWTVDSRREKTTILKRLLDLCSSDQVVLIIDRLDCMAKSKGSEYQQDLTSVLSWILGIVAGTTCNMKVMIIVDSTIRWEIDNDSAASEMWKSGSLKPLQESGRFKFQYKIGWLQEVDEDEGSA